MNEKFLKTIRLYLDNINLNENEYFSLCSIKFNEVKEVVLHYIFCEIIGDPAPLFYKFKFNNYEVDIITGAGYISLLNNNFIDKKFKNNKIDIAFKRDDAGTNLTGNIVIYLYVDSYDFEVETATNVIEK